MNWDAAHDHHAPAPRHGWHGWPQGHEQARHHMVDGGAVTEPNLFLTMVRQFGLLAAGVAVISAADTPALAAGRCGKAFVTPNQPMALTRTLRRELGDGREVVTRRSYRIHISPDGTGFRVDGELTGVEVTVPPQLEVLAQLERIRRDEGLFPILLDAQGTITRQDPPIGSGPTSAASSVSSAMIARSALPQTDKAQVMGFVDALLGMRGGVLTKWPNDLFRPAAAQASATTSVPMGSGQSGQVTVALSATADGMCGLLRSFERVVTTDAGGQQRVTREQWVLAPLAQ